MGIIVRSSAIHAAGCYTTAPIANGTRIVEYTGPRIPKDLADEKYENSITTYLFGLGDGEYVIDGHGAAMFINHSCNPNCETEEIDGRVWIMAIRDIAAGEELVYDYNLYDGGDDPAYCNCGAANCRKSMYSPEEIARRARAEKRAAAKKKARKKSAGKRSGSQMKKGGQAAPAKSTGKAAKKKQAQRRRP